MILTRSFHRTRHSPCAALVPTALPAVLVFAQVVAGIVAQVAVVPAAIVVAEDVIILVAEDVMVHVVPLVGVTDVPATALLLAEWTALVDVAVVLLHVEAAPEFAEMVVDITAAVIAVVVLKILTIQAPALKLINLED